MIFSPKKFNSQIVALIHPIKKIKVINWKMLLIIKLVLFFILYELPHPTSAKKVSVPGEKQLKLKLY